MDDKSNAAVLPGLSFEYDDTLFRTFGDKLILDPLEELNEQRKIDWTEEEKQIFTKKFLEHPKKFGLIAENIPNKTAAQCVQYYYMSKRKINYKKMLRKKGLIDLPLAKLDQPKRKAAIKAMTTLTDNIYEDIYPAHKRQCKACPSKDIEVAKFDEIWLVMDENHTEENNNNHWDSQQRDLLSLTDYDQIGCQNFRRKEASLQEANISAATTGSTAVNINNKNFDPAGCINRIDEMDANKSLSG